MKCEVNVTPATLLQTALPRSGGEGVQPMLLGGGYAQLNGWVVFLYTLFGFFNVVCVLYVNKF